MAAATDERTDGQQSEEGNGEPVPGQADVAVGQEAIHHPPVAPVPRSDSPATPVVMEKKKSAGVKKTASQPADLVVIEMGVEPKSDFEDKNVRLAFIRKVYAILSVQLLVTFGIVLIFALCDAPKAFAKENTWIAYVGMGLSFAILIPLACCCNLRRRFPVNLILLTLFTLAQAVTIGIIAALHETEAVVTAIGITALVTIALTIFAMQTAIDFTVWNGIAFICLIVLMLMGLVLLIFPGIPYLRVVYSALGALLFSFYILIDTQMIVGGKNRKNQISPDEYILAVINLYLDIINLFLNILSLVSKK